MTEPETDKEEFNVLNHDLVPIHELLTEEQTRQLFEKHNINPEQLPKILSSDPAALAIGAKGNQVVRIRRNSRTAGQAVAYRLVVDYAAL